MQSISSQVTMNYDANYRATDALEENLQPTLAAIVSDDKDNTDAILDGIVMWLQHEGYHLSGLLQRVMSGGNGGCGIRLQDIASGDYFRITQDLGSGSVSCNIDNGAVEQLAMTLSTTLDDSIDLVIINRFGKRESEGAGFCSVIEKAVDLGIPVLTVVKKDWRAAWLAYGGDCVSTLHSNKQVIEDWCQRVLPVLSR